MEVAKLLTKYTADTSDLDRKSVQADARFKQTTKSATATEKAVSSVGKSSQTTAKQVSTLSTSTSKLDKDATSAAKSAHKMAEGMDSAKKSATGLLTSLRGGFSIGGGGVFGSSGGIIPGLANISSIIRGIPQIGQLAGAIIHPLTEAAEEGIKLNMTLETAELAFAQVAGSAQKAREHLLALQAFGAKSPFRFEGLLAGARLMTTFGFAIDEQIPKLRIWGNAIAAGGEITEERVHRVVTALGQMRTAGRVNAQDMLQLTNANIPGWQLLAKAIGKTVAETRKLAENGKLNGKVAVEAITAMMAIDKRFEGMMQKMEKTTAGRLSAIQDNIQIAQGAATQGLTENLSQTIQHALDRPDLLPKLAAQINSILTPVSAIIETGVKSILTPGITTGIVEGIKLGKDMVKNALVDFAEDTIIGSIKGALGIGSPSKEFMILGHNSAEGFRDGLIAGIGDMTGDMIDAFDDMLDDLDGFMQSRQKRFVSVKQKSRANLDKLIAKEPDFLPKLIAGAKSRGMDPDHILNVMAVETAGSFNPFARNPTSSASGMIQFMRDTAPTLGTTIEAIRKMNATQQLDYVFKYFDQYIKRFGPLDTQGKVYAAVGTGKVARDDEAIVMRQGQRGYEGNKATWDRNMDGLIRQSEMAQAAIAKLGAGIDFTVNGQPIGPSNPLAVYAVKTDITGGASAIFGRTQRPSARSTPSFSTSVSFDDSSLQIADPFLRLTGQRSDRPLTTSMDALPASMLQLKPLTPMLIESAEAAKKLADEMARAGGAAQALGPGQWYEAATAIGSMQQRLSEFFDTLPENKRFMEDVFISLPARFGDVIGDSFLRAGSDVKGFFREVQQEAVNMLRSIAADVLRQLVTRSLTNLFISMVGRPQMDPETGEATGKIMGGWGWLRGLGSLLGGVLPKRAFGGPVYAGQPVIVGDHPRGLPNPEIFIPHQSGSIIPLGQATQQTQTRQEVSRLYLVDSERAARERGAAEREIIRLNKRMRKLGRLVPI